MKKTTQEKVQVMLAYDQGKNCEYKQKHDRDWDELYGTPDWDWTHLDYRIKQVSPLIIPWDAINPEYKWAAKDDDGEIYAYTEKPFLGSILNWLSGGYYRKLDLLNNVKDPDNIDWKESLIQRPD